MARIYDVDEDGLRRVHMANVAGYSNVPVASAPACSDNSGPDRTRRTRRTRQPQEPHELQEPQEPQGTDAGNKNRRFVYVPVYNSSK